MVDVNSAYGGSLFEEPIAPVRRLSVPDDALADVATFRGLPWGAAQHAVGEHETGALRVKGEDEDVIIYATVLDDLKVDVAYLFTANELVRAKYLVTESFVDDNAYLRAFDGFKTMLTTKYGYPARDDERWSDDLFQHDYAQWGMAASVGHYTRSTFWSRPSGEVCLALHGEHHRVGLEIEYSSRRHVEAAAAQHTQRLLADL